MWIGSQLRGENSDARHFFMLSPRLSWLYMYHVIGIPVYMTGRQIPFSLSAKPWEYSIYIGISSCAFFNLHVCAVGGREREFFLLMSIGNLS